MTDSSRRPAGRIEVAGRSCSLDTLTGPDYAISFELNHARMNT